jgi:hypothetical protein
MSQRRAVSRTERRHMNQELHLIRRGLEHSPSIFTEDEVAAAKLEAIESVSEHRFKVLERDIANAISICYQLDDQIAGLQIGLDGAKGLQHAFLNEFVRVHDGHRRLQSDVNKLWNSVRMIGRAASLTSDRHDAESGAVCRDCGTRYDLTHACSIGFTETASRSLSVATTPSSALITSELRS